MGRASAGEATSMRHALYGILWQTHARPQHICMRFLVPTDASLHIRIWPVSCLPSSFMSRNVAAAKAATQDALAKAQLAAEMQRTIAAQMANMTGAESALPAKPPTVRLDNQGRLIDERGKVIQSTAKPEPTVKINQTARSNPLLEVGYGKLMFL
eukprot:6183632-Pleurochrysis_carterae.AAC.1